MTSFSVAEYEFRQHCTKQGLLPVVFCRIALTPPTHALTVRCHFVLPRKYDFVCPLDVILKYFPRPDHVVGTNGLDYAMFYLEGITDDTLNVLKSQPQNLYPVMSEATENLI
jgi:hypothetical protein